MTLNSEDLKNQTANLTNMALLKNGIAYPLNKALCAKG